MGKKSVIPAYIAVAGFDPMRDEGIAYAKALRLAGVPTTLRVHNSLVHPFPAVLSIRACRETVLEVATLIRLELGRVSNTA